MKAIGGYFELELHKGQLPHQDALAFNSGKNCLDFLLLCQCYTKVYVPYYTCGVIYKPLEQLHIPYELYNIDRNLEPTILPDLKEGEAFLYTNYFGLKDECVARLVRKYGRSLIVDNAQAFFAKPLEGVSTFYSPRKFMGVPDGGFLYLVSRKVKREYEKLEQSASYNRIGHLVKRIDLSPEEAYMDFKSEDESLSDEPIMKMSNLTQAMLASIDYREISERRRKNYQYLHTHMKKINRLQFDLSQEATPFVYPLYVENAEQVRGRLLEAKIYCATYWPNVLDWCQEGDLEYELAKNLIPLPIDQRYGEEEMKKIIKIICEQYMDTKKLTIRGGGYVLDL